jgi:hypothetical protein
MASRRKPSTDSGHSWPELMNLVPAALEAGVSTLILGHPGLGKSAFAAILAERYDLPLVDIRLAQQEPADLAGVYFPNKERNCLDLLPPNWVRDLVERPAFLFLDEINAAVSQLHQAVAYQMVLERRLGPFAFHPGTMVLAAGNLEEDAALASPLSSALANRFAHFRMRVDAEAWLDWAADNAIDPSLIAYVARHGAEVLYDRSAGATAFPSPRSWEMASRVIAGLPKKLTKHGLSACVGAPAASKFMQFMRLYNRIHPKKLICDGHTIDFSSGKQAEPSFVHAAVYSVADWLRNEAELKDSQLPNVTAFLRSKGLDPEYWLLFLRQIKSRRDLLARLKMRPEFRELAAGMVDLHAGLYA